MKFKVGDIISVSDRLWNTFKSEEFNNDNNFTVIGIERTRYIVDHRTKGRGLIGKEYALHCLQNILPPEDIKVLEDLNK